MLSHHVLPEQPISSLDGYRARGGGRALEAASRLGPLGVVDELTASGLRGRGGAGFPTGVKWSSIAAGGETVGDRYVVANGAEGEPGSFKDRMLLRTNPYQVLEGLLVAASVLAPRAVVLALKSSFAPERAAVDRAWGEMVRAGWSPDHELQIVEGPDEYLFGEEKALLEVIEGEDPLPRFFPPYLYGLFTTSPQMGWSAGIDDHAGDPVGEAYNPTLVNNVETYAHVAAVLAHGADWYRTTGTDASPGPTLVTVSGATRRAGVAEVAMGTSVREVLEVVGGGMPEGRSVKAVLSGVANPVLTAADLDVAMTYEDLDAVGSGLGAAGFVVYDDTTDMVAVAHAVSRFLAVESCGQCPPCKLGTTAITRHLDRLLRGEGGAADLEHVDARLATVTDANRCALGLQERLVVGSILDRFPEEAVRLTSGLPAPVPEPMVAKIVDLVDGEVVLDDRYWTKRGDWTYGEPRRRV